MEFSEQIRVLVLDDGIRRFLAEVEVDAADGHVHRRQSPDGGIALIRLLPPQPHPAGALRTSQMGAPRPLVLPVNRENPQLAAVFLDEALGLHNAPSACATSFREAHTAWSGIPDKEAAGAHGGVIDAALIGLDHLDDEADDCLGREVLAALFPLR